MADRSIGPAPTVSYVVGTHDRYPSLRRLIESIARTTPFHWELLVADCTPPNEHRAAFQESVASLIHPLGSLSVCREWPRRGMRVAYNDLFSRCRAPWVVFLNDDAEVCRECPREAVAFMQSHPSIGLGAIYYQESPGTSWRVNDYRGMIYANFGIVHRGLGDHVGWFGDSEAIVTYGVDNVLAWEVLKAGFGVVGIPRARVIHHVDAHPRKEQDSREHRPRASEWLAKTYEHELPLMKVVHDRHRDLGGKHLSYPAESRIEDVS